MLADGDVLGVADTVPGAVADMLGAAVDGLVPERTDIGDAGVVVDEVICAGAA
jgi:hypothetical protein